jgi:hypothetical protein
MSRYLKGWVMVHHDALLSCAGRRFWRSALVGLSLVLVMGAAIPTVHADAGGTRGCHGNNPWCDTGTATPELGSGELVVTGLLPIGSVLLYRRRAQRRARRAGNQPTE